MKYQFGKIAVLITVLSALFASAKLYAESGESIIAYPPHQVKPTMPSLAPTGLTPTQISRAYGLNYIPFQGENQVIGIVNAYDNPTIESDLGTFSTQFGLPSCTTGNGCFTKIYASGSQPPTNATWALETALDVEWAHAIAPNAKIILVEAANASVSALSSAVGVAVNNGATTISLSWGANEFSGQTTIDATFRTYIVAGVTLFAASGDNGYGVSWPASSTYVIAVGGTSLSVDSAGNYLSETAWSGSGGGLSVYEPQTGPQTNFPIPNNPYRRRGVPDVAYNADPNKGFSVYDTASGGWIVVGGTSAGSPQWAALVAVAKSGTHKKLTSVYTALYTLAKLNQRHFYNDISSGTNGTCGYYCTARGGYDYVTGLGSPQVLQLLYELMYYA